MILIENEYELRYGVFLYESIYQYQTFNTVLDIYESVIDPQSFIFTFQHHSTHQFQIKKEYQYESTFHLCEKQKRALFAVGNVKEYEIWIGKKEFQSYSKQSSLSYYHYTQSNNIVNVNKKDNDNTKFNIKRIIVFEMKNVNENN